MDIEDALDQLNTSDNADNENMEMEVETLDENQLQDMSADDDLVEYSEGEIDDDQEEEVTYQEVDDESELYQEDDEDVEEIIETVTPAKVAALQLANYSSISIKKAEPKTVVHTKIAPKSSALAQKNNQNGQYVVIQSPGGNNIPVKLLNSVTSTGQSATTATASYHLVKSSDGTIVKVAKSQPTTQIVKKVAPNVINNNNPNRTKVTQVVLNSKLNNSTAAPGSKSITVNHAGIPQMGFLTPKIKQLMVPVKKPQVAILTKAPLKILPAPSSTSGTPFIKMKPAISSSSTGTSSSQQKVIIQQSGKPVVTKNVTPNSSTQKIVVSQHALKAGQQTGQIQAINIPGKGVQYVRFVNPPGNSNTNSNKVVAASNISKAASPGVMATTPGLKMGVPTKTYLINSNTPTTLRQYPSTQNRTVTMAKKPIPTSSLVKQLENSNVPTKLIAVVKKDENGATEAAKITTLTTSQLSQLQGATILPGTNKTKIVMLPSDYMQQLQKISQNQNISITSKSGSSFAAASASNVQVKQERIDSESEREDYRSANLSGDDGYKKRACNCAKSQCLKLYCDCFANGEFCYNCNCKDCFNNLENEEERQKAIRATLERNPVAFKPKIGAALAENDTLRHHTKGCNCKRSGCLKNYCECYEAKIVCSGNCKCVGCRNTDARMHNYLDYVPGSDVSIVMVGNGNNSASNNGSGGSMSNETSQQHPNHVAGIKRPGDDVDFSALPPTKQPYNFMTPDVIEATVQCMIAQADECQKRGCSSRTAERMILEEFGRCLVEIIDFSSKNDN